MSADKMKKTAKKKVMKTARVGGNGRPTMKKAAAKKKAKKKVNGKVKLA